MLKNHGMAFLGNAFQKNWSYCGFLEKSCLTVPNLKIFSSKLFHVFFSIFFPENDPCEGKFQAFF